MANSKTALARLQSSVKRHKASKQEAMSNVLDTAVQVGTGVGVGFLRGKFADKTSADWHIPKTEIDAEIPIGLALGGLGLFGVGGKHLSRAMLVSGGTTLAILAARKTEIATAKG
jgi:hypothetical protein